MTSMNALQENVGTFQRKIMFPSLFSSAKNIRNITVEADGRLERRVGRCAICPFYIVDVVKCVQYSFIKGSDATPRCFFSSTSLSLLTPPPPFTEQYV